MTGTEPLDALLSELARDRLDIQKLGEAICALRGQDQLAVAMDRVTEMRSAILSRRKAWEGATVPEAPKEQPKPAGQTNLEGGKAPANAGPIVRCIKCGTAVEPKTSQKGVEYSYCPKCKDNRRKDGTEFPPKKEA